MSEPTSLRTSPTPPVDPTTDATTAPTTAPATGTVPAEPWLAPPGTPATEHLSDPLIDSLDKAFRRLRRSMVKPPAATVPVPALGRRLDVAQVFACTAIWDLSESQSTVTVKDVAAALGLEHSTVSRLLGEAEAGGLISRGVDPDDRRRTSITLTHFGQLAAQHSLSMNRYFTRVLLSDWDRSEVEQLTKLMTRLATTVDERMESLHERAMIEFGGGVHRHTGCASKNDH